jgi:cobalt-zinc-cadmium efflux system outer membrane protein
MTLGSGLAWSTGFPLSIEGSAPSIIDFNSQQTLFNPAQRQFIRAARTEWQASGATMEDRRAVIILETATTYSELDKLMALLRVLRQQNEAATRAEQIAAERVREGVDSPLEQTRARLGAARVRMRLAEVNGSADVLRLRLSQLTGLPDHEIETDSETIPRLPELGAQDDLAARAASSSPQVQAAEQQAQAQEQRAQGEHRAMLPAADFVVRYSLLSRHNNFEDFFQRFQRHNATIGAALRFPFLDFAQRARAGAADAQAVKARRQAEVVKHQVSSETLRLQREVGRLKAAREVARLEHQLARSDVDVALARSEAGEISLREVESARVAESASYAGFLDADFALERAQMQLLRITGELQRWALGD